MLHTGCFDNVVRVIDIRLGKEIEMVSLIFAHSFLKVILSVQRVTVLREPLTLLTVESEYKTSAWVSREKLFALSARVAAENSEERLQIMPVDRETTPLVISEIHCFGNRYVIIVVQKEGKGLYGWPIIDIVHNAFRERGMEPCADGTVTGYIRDIISDTYEYLNVDELLCDGLAGGINIRIILKSIRYGKMYRIFGC